MKILNLSLDKNILDQNSAVAGRIMEYGELVEKFDVVAPADADVCVSLSSKIGVCGIGSQRGKISVFLKMFARAVELIKAERYDLLTVQDPYFLAWMGLRLARRFSIKFELQIHGLEKFCGLRKMIFKYAVKRADSIRVVSERMKKFLVEEIGVVENKIKVLSIFTDISLFTITGRSYAAKKPFILLSVGRLVPVKNVAMQIEAMEVIIKTHPEVELHIVGDGILREKLEALAKEKGLEKNVKFLGWQKDMPQFYKDADVFVLTSDSEGWGMVVVEAGASGLPIVMTDVGCAGEFIKDGESGLIVPVGDKKKFIEAILELIENADLRKKLGENAAKAAGKLPNKDEYLEKIKNIWENSV